MMDQLDDLAVNGKIHHYKIDTGLFLLLFHGRDALTEEHKQRVKDARDAIGLKPTKKKSAQVAKDALDLLNEVRALIPGPTYSAIYQQLNEGMLDASS